jgi:hypothetical protein
MEVEQETEEGEFSEGETQEQEEYAVTEEQVVEQKEEEKIKANNQGEDRSGFIHGLSVGLGMGCIATFVIMWIAIFFSPQLPPTLTYEVMLSIFIYPLLYLLSIGLIALTAGIVREYYVRK